MQNKKCKYGFYTCSFIGQVDFCNSCDEGQNYQMKETRGGKRAGAGRKKLAPTKTVSFRVKEEYVEGVKNAVSEFLGGEKNKEKNAT